MMSLDVLRLIAEICRTAAMIYADTPDIIIERASRVPPELKAQLKERKAEVLGYFEEQSFWRSRQRLEFASVCLAISPTGDLRIVTSEDMRQAARKGFSILAPRDAHYYVRLRPHERVLLERFRKLYGGSMEWKFE
jgi:hypothetical protein